MAWPTPQDYSEAVQHPALNFENPEIKAGQVEITPLGLPRPRSGNFATVFKIKCKEHNWAIRCFLRQVTDQRERYAAISKDLAPLKIPYMVGFQYIPEGILVKGEWYPILKMEWAEGELLDKFVYEHLHDSSILQKLADSWVTMLQALETAKIAHGDLQHGNILIFRNDFKLIDYDGMFVPTLKGSVSNELGHANYQHPSRENTDFRADIDRFSAWVIYISLVSLSIDPSLWEQTDGGDECLILRKEDFENPDSSKNLGLLVNHKNARIKLLAKKFQQLCKTPLSQIPPLEATKISSTNLKKISKKLKSTSLKNLLSGVLTSIFSKHIEVLVVILMATGIIFWALSPPPENYETNIPAPIVKIPLLKPIIKPKPVKVIPEVPKTAILKITSNIEDSTVFINGQNSGIIGTEPLSLTLAQDYYTVRIEKDGFISYETKVQLQEFKSLIVRLRPKPPKIIPLRIYANVNNDILIINGKKYGSTPFEKALPHGLYTVRVEKEGFIPNEQQINLQQEKTLYIKLKSPLLYTFTGHKGGVRSVSFSPNGRKLASGSSDKTIKIWNVNTGRLRYTLAGHTEEVASIAYSPDGRKLASGSYDNTIKVWNSRTGRLLYTLTGHEDWVNFVAFNPNGNILASASNDKTIKLWDVSRGELLYTLTGHKQLVTSLSFSPDGRTLISSSWDRNIMMWDTYTGKYRRTLFGHNNWVNFVSFSSDGHTIASISKDHTLKFWDIRTVGERKTVWQRNNIISLAFSPDGRVLASGDENNKIKLWQVSTTKILQTMLGHQNWIRSLSFSPDGRMLASASDDKTIKLWYVESLKK
jgi:WD40 repeat protein/predicted Ser/Thr protein kinase